MPFSEQSSVLNASSSSAQDIAGAAFVIGIMSSPRVDYRKIKQHVTDPVFPKDCLVDTVEGKLVRPDYDNSLQTVGPLPVPIWITRY